MWRFMCAWCDVDCATYFGGALDVYLSCPMLMVPFHQFVSWFLFVCIRSFCSSRTGSLSRGLQINTRAVRGRAADVDERRPNSTRSGEDEINTFLHLATRRGCTKYQLVGLNFLLDARESNRCRCKATRVGNTIHNWSLVKSGAWRVGVKLPITASTTHTSFNRVFTSTLYMI